MSNDMYVHNEAQANDELLRDELEKAARADLFGNTGASCDVVLVPQSPKKSSTLSYISYGVPTAAGSSLKMTRPLRRHASPIS